MKGRKLDKLAAQGGQFFGWRFMQKGAVVDFASIFIVSGTN
jgi:hypothetical protein